MTATTPPSLGIFQDHHQAPHYRFTVFPWQAHLFLEYQKIASFEFQTFENPEPPYLIVFQINCKLSQLHHLINNYMVAGYPFAITNFNLKPETNNPLTSVHL